jgi:hypothetical protein
LTYRRAVSGCLRAARFGIPDFRTTSVRSHIADLERRRARLIEEVENLPIDLDESTTKAFRTTVQQRFAAIGHEIAVKQAECESVTMARASAARDSEDVNCAQSP